MKRFFLHLLLLFVATGIGSAFAQNPNVTLREARKNFRTTLLPQTPKREPAPLPPDDQFILVKYPATAGPLVAYLSRDPRDGKKHPAIVWITGGDCNSIGDVWSAAPRNNDQTAAAYRNAGIIMMFPSLRGGNFNPGVKEGFLGEVDDVIAAAEYLKKQPSVDPNRIYLGGHSSGGTLALLVSEYSPMFRAVFSFGPVGDIARYRTEDAPVDFNNKEEIRLRSPGHWLSSITSPTWVLEGSNGNISSLRSMSAYSKNPKVQFVEIKNTDHFALLTPMNDLFARKIVQDTGPECSITLTPEEIPLAFEASRSKK